AGRRTLRTDQCLDALPTLARTVHSQDARSWRTRCATPQSDPRYAVVNTYFFVAPGDDSISIAESGRYEFTINESPCVADVQRAPPRSRVAVAPTSSGRAPPGAKAAPVAAPAPGGANPYVETPKPDCSVPREPARLEVRPARKLLRTGDTFSFRARVLDG